MPVRWLYIVFKVHFFIDAKITVILANGHFMICMQSIVQKCLSFSMIIGVFRKTTCIKFELCAYNCFGFSDNPRPQHTRYLKSSIFQILDIIHNRCPWSLDFWASWLMFAGPGELCMMRYNKVRIFGRYFRSICLMSKISTSSSYSLFWANFPGSFYFQEKGKITIY